jgi:hypothetical protein
MVDVMRDVGASITTLRGRWLASGSRLWGGARGGRIGWGARRERTFFIGAFWNVYVNIFPKIGARLDGGGDTSIPKNTLGSSTSCVLRFNSSRNIIGIWRSDTTRHDCLKQLTGENELGIYTKILVSMLSAFRTDKQKVGHPSVP